jgi:hypothetical protein
MIPQKVDLNAKPAEVVWRRTYIPTGEIGKFAETGLTRWVNFDGTPGSYNIGKEFTDAELDVIRKTPFLAARIEASSQVPTPIGYNDSYKNRAERLDARQIYNFATKNPLEFLKSELPAYLGANDANASIKLIEAIKDAGEPVENLQKLYEGALKEAPRYAETYSQFSAKKYAENQGSSDPLGKFIKQYIIPIATTAGAIAGGPVGAAVANSIAQLSETGKIDPVQVALAYGTAYIAAGGASEGLTESIQAATGLSTEAAKVASGAVLGAGISTAAGGDPLKGAIAGAVGAVGSTTYATQVGNALNVTGAAAPIVGNAVINAGLSGIAAVATGANVEKSMLDGAIKGAAVAGSTEFAEAILGKDNIASIAKAAGLEDKQIASIFTTSVANGVTAEISGQGEFLETVGISVAAQGVGAKSANLMQNAIKNVLDKDPEIMAGVLTATKGIAQTATSAALQGIDVGEALERTAPGVILSSVQAYQAEANRQDELRRQEEERAAAQREKDIVASQQPVLVAGPEQPSLTELETVLQVAANRGERVTSLGEQDGIESFQVTGTRDDGSTYSYQILSSPEIGIRYEFGSVPLDPLSGRVDPTRTLQTTVSETLPEFRDDPTIGVPTQPIPDAVGRAAIEPVLSQQVRDAALSTIIENELRQLEGELQAAEQRRIQARERATQAEQQFERLSDLPTGRGIGQDVAQQLEEELSGLEESARRAEEETTTLGQQRERIGSFADAEGDAQLSDQDLLTFLQTGELPGGRGRLLGEEGAPDGAPEGTPEGEGTEPGEAGAGEGGVGEGGTGEGGEGEGADGTGEIRTPLSPSLIFDRETGGRPTTTPFGSRVTGEALASILGEKEPLFGGDDDEQRAVWNRRSLKLLSRALGL